MPDAFYTACESRILPALRQLTTIDKMMRFRGIRSIEFELAVKWVIYQIHFSAAFGHFDRALRRFERIKHWEPAKLAWHRRPFEHVADELVPLMRADDRAGVIRLLHQWEESRVRKYGLEAIYESTPFPLELSPGA